MQLYAILSLIGQFSKQDGFLFVSLTFDCSFPPSFSSSFLRISPLTALSTENRHAVGITTATTLTRRRRCCRRRCCCRPSLSPSCSEKKGSAEHLSLISRNLASDSPSPVRWPRSALAPRGTTGQPLRTRALARARHAALPSLLFCLLLRERVLSEILNLLSSSSSFRLLRENQKFRISILSWWSLKMLAFVLIALVASAQRTPSGKI